MPPLPLPLTLPINHQSFFNIIFMKSIFYKALAMLTIMAGCATLSSCGDDNDEPKQPEPAAGSSIVKYKVMSAVDASADYFAYYDFTVTYTDADGQSKTETITHVLAKEIEFAAAAAPAKAVFKVEAKPKANYPEIDPSHVYTLSSKVIFLVEGYDAAGSTKYQNGTLVPMEANASARGDRLETVLAAGRVRTICDRELEVRH